MISWLQRWRGTIFNLVTGLSMALPPIIDLLSTTKLTSTYVTVGLGVINILGNVYLKLRPAPPEEKL